MRSWQDRAAALAADIAGPGSGWADAVGRVPRHVLVPRWFSRDGGAWVVRDGPSDEPAWLDVAYDGTTSLVTRVGDMHADQAEPGARQEGRPASSATMPRLVLDMYRRARLYDGAATLDVGTGSGYGAALLAARYGAGQVTSIDIDGYVSRAPVAAVRLQARPGPGLGRQPAQPALTVAGDFAENGRGLFLVQAFSERWGSYPAPQTGGKVVWALCGINTDQTVNPDIRRPGA